MDLVKKIIASNTRMTAALLSLSQNIVESLAREHDISPDFIRHQVAARFEENCNNQRRDVESDAKQTSYMNLLEETSLSNQALLETIYHYYIRLEAKQVNLPPSDVQEHLDQFRDNWIDYLRDHS